MEVVQLMTFKVYFRYALFIPFICGLIAMILEFCFGLAGGNFIVFIVMLSVLIGGFPYALFVACTFYWMRGRTDREVKKAMWLAPLIFLPFLSIAILLAIPPDSFYSAGEAVLFLCFFGLIFGYCYVLIAYAGWKIVQFSGWHLEEG
ncbi:hypothetical protein KCN56_01160 [Photobacterium galatheae]|uniref:hypothetical protein n=1 Tax=Photobacterium galatheae TaxID=1654360 RepID=UPI00202CCD8F|nr:hypothetical protein [Photobacterium galatheae]MCM0147176.1 hypothetical protein [Photobacterium galatheae]